MQTANKRTGLILSISPGVRCGLVIMNKKSTLFCVTVPRGTLCGRVRELIKTYKIENAAVERWGKFTLSRMNENSLIGQTYRKRVYCETNICNVLRSIGVTIKTIKLDPDDRNAPAEMWMRVYGDGSGIIPSVQIRRAVLVGYYYFAKKRSAR